MIDAAEFVRSRDAIDVTIELLDELRAQHEREIAALRAQHERERLRNCGDVASRVRVVRL